MKQQPHIHNLTLDEFAEMLRKLALGGIEEGRQHLGPERLLSVFAGILASAAFDLGRHTMGDPQRVLDRAIQKAVQDVEERYILVPRVAPESRD